MRIRALGLVGGVLLAIGCASLPPLPEHAPTRRYPLACVEDAQRGGDAPRRLTRTFDDQGRATGEVTRDVEGRVLQTKSVLYLPRLVETTTTNAAGEDTLVMTLYDRDGRLVRTIGEGYERRYEYEGGRLVREIHRDLEGAVQTVHLTYRDGELTQRVAEGSAGFRTEYSRSAAGDAVTREWSALGEGANGPQRPVVTRVVETREAGRLVSRARYVDDRWHQRTEYERDAHGNLIEARQSYPSRPARRVTYWYGCWPD